MLLFGAHGILDSFSGYFLPFSIIFPIYRDVNFKYR